MDIWMISRNDNSYIVLGSRFFYLDFYRFEIIAFLLTGFVKPVREKTLSLCLLSTDCATHIKQNVRIRTKECFNNTKHRLPNLFVIGRSCASHSNKIKPICNEFWIILQREVHEILQAVISLKKRNGHVPPIRGKKKKD